MKWYIPLLMEIQGGHYDWSEPHVVRFRQMFKRIQDLLQEARPFITKYAVPLISDILEEDLSMLPMFNKLLDGMRPKKKKAK